MFKSTSMFNNSRSSAHSSSFAEENDSSIPLVLSPEPLRWAPTARNDNFITTDDKNTTIVMAYEFFHFMGTAGDCNPKLTGVGSKKNRVHDDDNDAEADRHKRKKGMYVDVENDLKLGIPILTLSSATGSGGMRKSGSGGISEESTSKTEKPDLNLKP